MWKWLGELWRTSNLGVHTGTKLYKIIYKTRKERLVLFDLLPFCLLGIFTLGNM